jgi:hypothetical protein
MNNSKSREYRLPVQPDHIRSFSDPFNQEVKILHAYVRVADFPHGKLPDEINPRRHEKLSGHIPADIRATVTENPRAFHLLNRGMLIVAKNAWYDNKSGKLHILIDSETEGGLADGATTDRVLAELKSEISQADFDTLAADEIPTHLKEAYVHVEIISSIQGEMLVPLTDARNNSLAVKEFALEDLRGGYDTLKATLEKSRLQGRIRYRQNDSQPVDIRTVLGLLTLFHPVWDAENKEPVVAYSSKGAVLSLFQDDIWKKGFNRLVPVAVDILELHDYIHEHFQEQYQKVFGPNGKLGRRVEVRFRQNASIELPLTGARVAYGIPDGWIYPMLASFRVLLAWPKNETGTVKWEKDPKAFFDANGGRLVEMIVEYSENLGRNPMATGKSKFLWTSLKTQVQLLKQNS